MLLVSRVCEGEVIICMAQCVYCRWPTLNLTAHCILTLVQFDILAVRAARTRAVICLDIGTYAVFSHQTGTFVKLLLSLLLHHEA